MLVHRAHRLLSESTRIVCTLRLQVPQQRAPDHQESTIARGERINNVVKAGETLTHVQGDRFLQAAVNGDASFSGGSSRDASIYGDCAIPNVLGPSRNKCVHSNTPVHGRNKADRNRRWRSPPP